METRDNENSTLAFLPDESTILPKDQLRERIKIEFYKTYDVMTGIRIAATLGGFFSMMILLVLYKNYCKPSKTLSEEQLNAAVTAAAEEEDRALQAALEATSFYTSLEKRRQSLENANPVLLSPRFSSVGGGYSHLAPPLKASVLQQRGKSLPGSVLQFNSSGLPSPLQRDRKLSQEDFTCKNYLNIYPSRRVSSVTCSSADSAYLERRCSAFEMGLPVPPHFLRNSKEKLAGKRDESWDYYYPIDIQVIQPTPEMSPSVSEKNLHEDSTICGLQVPGIHDQTHSLSVATFDIGLAPLASISSLGGFSQSSLATSKGLTTSSSNLPLDGQGTTADDSVGSDSVFMDVDELSTDSEFEYDGFDDDYSFCESKQKPSGRPEGRPLQFASFDSYDASITEEVDTDGHQGEHKPPPRVLTKQNSGDLKRNTSLRDGTRARRKLVKTYSEPRSGKAMSKALPPWTEKGRSGYVPTRQMSSPSKKRNSANGVKSPAKACPDSAAEVKSSPEVDNAKDENLKKLQIHPKSNSSSSDSVTLTPSVQRADSAATSLPSQGLHNDLPSLHQARAQKQYSLPSAKEKRSRWLQKQRNFAEDVKAANQTKTDKTDGTAVEDDSSTCTFLTSPGDLLKPPNVPQLTDSCKKLTNLEVTKEESIHDEESDSRVDLPPPQLCDK